MEPLKEDDVQDLIKIESTNELKLLETNVVITKDELKDRIRTVVLSGTRNVAQVGVTLKRIKESLDDLFKDDQQFKDAIRIDTEKYIEKGKTATILGAQVTVMATSTSYDFKETGDIYLLKLYEIQQDIKDKIKLREDALKLLLKEQEAKENKGLGLAGTVTKDEIIPSLPNLVDEVCGEVVTLKPPIKYQSIGLKYSKI